MGIWRYPKTKNEMTQYYKEPQLVRQKRNPYHLEHAWDDYLHTTPRCWKEQSKKRRQHGYNQKRIIRVKKGASDDAPFFVQFSQFVIVLIMHSSKNNLQSVSKSRFFP